MVCLWSVVVRGGPVGGAVAGMCLGDGVAAEDLLKADVLDPQHLGLPLRLVHLSGKGRWGVPTSLESETGVGVSVIIEILIHHRRFHAQGNFCAANQMYFGCVRTIFILSA